MASKTSGSRSCKPPEYVGPLTLLGQFKRCNAVTPLNDKSRQVRTFELIEVTLMEEKLCLQHPRWNIANRQFDGVSRCTQRIELLYCGVPTRKPFEYIKGWVKGKPVKPAQCTGHQIKLAHPFRGDTGQYNGGKHEPRIHWRHHHTALRKNACHDLCIQSRYSKRIGLYREDFGFLHGLFYNRNLRKEKANEEHTLDHL